MAHIQGVLSAGSDGNLCAAAGTAEGCGQLGDGVHGVDRFLLLPGADGNDRGARPCDERRLAGACLLVALVGRSAVSADLQPVAVLSDVRTDSIYQTHCL